MNTITPDQQKSLNFLAEVKGSPLTEKEIAEALQASRESQQRRDRGVNHDHKLVRMVRREIAATLKLEEKIAELTVRQSRSFL